MLGGVELVGAGSSRPSTPPIVASSASTTDLAASGESVETMVLILSMLSARPMMAASTRWTSSGGMSGMAGLDRGLKGDSAVEESKLVKDEEGRIRWPGGRMSRSPAGEE